MGMKAKGIKLVLASKLDDWLASVEDETVKNTIKHNVIITGGSIASMLLGEEVNDYDVYFRTKEAALIVARYYLNRFDPKKRNGLGIDIRLVEYEDRIQIKVQSAGIASEGGTDKPYEYFESRAEGEGGRYVDEVMTDPADIADAAEALTEAAQNTEDEPGKPKYRPVFVSTNAISLSHRIQLIMRFFGEPEEIHNNYDYVHCTNYWTSWNKTLVLRPDALEALLSKELRYIGSKYPICSVLRLRKFLKRGWTINAGQILKMAMQISELDLKDYKVLEEQLTGVDVAYFCELIQKLHERDPEKVNTAYLVEIIDRMF